MLNTLFEESNIDNNLNSCNDILKFLLLIGKLKREKRAGWIRCGIPNPESISDHMYRVAMMAWALSPIDCDKSRCIKIALAHDVAECIIGDIIPGDIAAEEKEKMENEAYQKISSYIKDRNFADELYDCFLEYVKGSTPEARFVKHLDKLEMVLQALEYEKGHNIKLDSFFDTTRDQLEKSNVATLYVNIRGLRKDGTK